MLASYVRHAGFKSEHVSWRQYVDHCMCGARQGCSRETHLPQWSDLKADTKEFAVAA